MMLWNVVASKPAPSEHVEGDTLPRIFCAALARRANRVALRQKVLGVWQEESGAQVLRKAREVAMGLCSLGLSVGETISILSNTRKEWIYADLGALCAGLVSNGIYPTDSEEQTGYLCADSRTRLLFVEDDEQLDKGLYAIARVPHLEHIVVFEMRGLTRFHDPRVMSLDRLCALGAAYDAAHPNEFEHRINATKAHELAILIYTSGTTGKPKGAMISHANLALGYKSLAATFGQNENDERMCFLPLCHIYERQLGAYLSLYCGSVMNFVENPQTVAENIREIAPTVLGGVPRVWEKFYSAVQIALTESTRLQQALYKWAIGRGYAVTQLYLANKPIPFGLRLQYRLGRWLVLDNVRKFIGVHRTRYAVTGAAPISPELIRWYLALGVPMIEGWGMTETCGMGCINDIAGIRPGTIGKAFTGVEVRLSPEGEILVRGSNVFMGYLNQPEKTAETFTDGWLKTGDVGTMDAEGNLRITDRMKDIIITAGGKNITPSEWENELKFSPYISDAVVIGDKRPYLVALILIDQENVEKYAQDHNVAFSNYTSLTRAPEVIARIQGEVDKVNRKFAQVEQVKKFRLLEHQLTPEDEEMTPTMKLKRKLVQQKYAAVVEQMYAA